MLRQKDMSQKVMGLIPVRAKYFFSLIIGQRAIAQSSFCILNVQEMLNALIVLSLNVGDVPRIWIEAF